MLRIGIDLGGTKIEGIALDGDGTTRFRERVETPARDYRAIIRRVTGLVDRIESTLGRRGHVGIGTPGSLSPKTGLMRNSNTTCMNGMPVLADLQDSLGREIRLANDANCFALSEAVDGAGKDARVVFGVIIGTGTGAGVVIDRQVLGGCNAIAGEWGHNPLPWPRESELPGANCYCGKQGCIETWLSGPGMARDHTRHNAVSLDPRSIDQRAGEGDEGAEATLQRYEDRLARSLAHVINLLDPDVIVLGGGMGNIGRLYRRVPALLEHYVFSDVVHTRLLPPVHGDSSGVRGAAWLWPPEPAGPVR